MTGWWRGLLGGYVSAPISMIWTNARPEGDDWPVYMVIRAVAALAVWGVLESVVWLVRHVRVKVIE